MTRGQLVEKTACRHYVSTHAAYTVSAVVLAVLLVAQVVTGFGGVWVLYLFLGGGTWMTFLLVRDIKKERADESEPRGRPAAPTVQGGL